MDNSTQKPFACKAEGCGMSFTNEDHLTVHEKKHEMVLNLGLGHKGSNVFVADQTPTPTRLIKNCEEVGLFDDLKHVNPFDETFRRAVESKSNSEQNAEMAMENAALVIENQILGSEDSLHTPQVFPSVEENGGEFKIERQNVILSENINFKAKKEISEDKKENNEKIVRKRKLPREKSNSKKLVRKSAPDHLEQKSETGTTIPIILPGTISVIQPQIITVGYPTATVLPSKRILLPKPVETSNSSAAQLIPSKEKLRVVLNTERQTPSGQNTFANKKPDRNKCGDLKHMYDEDCMERRRAAAMRYRRKVKKEQCDLKRRNSELVAENSELKGMIKHLRQVLMAHQNCEISRATTIGTNIQLDDRSSIQMQPATVKLVMNIPKFIIHSAGKTPISTLSLSNGQK